MAVESLCAKLLGGQDVSCTPVTRRYYQQIVIINKSDIETFTITTTDYDAPSPVCAYNVEFTLKDGKTGYRFMGPEAGASYFGTFDKSRSDLGFTQYIHNANFLITGITEESKCILDSLDKGSFVVAYQLKDGTVEIYGIENGLSTGDYTYDVQGGGGGTAIILSSLETAPENYVPLVYVSAVPGSETEDFDAAFANTGS